MGGMHLIGKIILLILSLFFSIACSDVVEEQDQMIITAQGMITNGNCQEAINLLTQMTGIETSSRYYMTLASAQACFGSYNSIDFFMTDVGTIDTSPATDLMPSLSLMSTSANMTSSTDIDFTSIRDAINTLNFAGAVANGTYTERAAVFSTTDNNDISLFAAYLAIAGLGMLANFYGNVDGAGTKGAGAGASICYFQYTDAVAQGVVDGSVGDSCANPYTAPATDATLMCEGIVFVNTLFDILQQPDLPLPTDSGEISDIDVAVATFIANCEAVLGVADEVVCTTVSQVTCEGVSDQAREIYYATVFEELHR